MALSRFWHYLEDFPPIVVRLGARRGGKGWRCIGLSHQEIAIASNIRLSRVIEISMLFSFDAVLIGEAKAFCTACHFDPTLRADRQRQYDLVFQCQKKHTLQPPYYLRNSPQWHSQFVPLIRMLREHSMSPAPSASPQTSFAA